jgi:hypothetical protein
MHWALNYFRWKVSTIEFDTSMKPLPNVASFQVFLYFRDIENQNWPEKLPRAPIDEVHMKA